MIETAQDLILWQWPVKFIVTVAFYAFALKGLERLLRIAASVSSPCKALHARWYGR